MLLSFINIRKVPRDVLKTEGFFQHLLRDLANVNEWKIVYVDDLVNILSLYP